MAESNVRRNVGASPRINNSDYDRDKGRESIGKKKIFPVDDKTTSSCWGFPRWACLVTFFTIFGVLAGLTTWLIIKN